MEWIEQEKKRIAEEKKLNPPKPRRKKRGRPKKRKYNYVKTKTLTPFQEAYRQLLKREGMTQRDLAAALGIDPSLVSRELKKTNYFDPKLRQYVEMLGYRIVLSFEKVGEPHIVKRKKSAVTLKAIEGKKRAALEQSGGVWMGDEMSGDEIESIAFRYAGLDDSSLPSKETEVDTNV